jgi:PAS domain-containing protein
VPIHFEHDHIWIGHDDMIGVGYQFLEPGSIVFVNERFFELLGYRKATGLWWVQEIVTEGAADDLHPAMFTEWKPDA